MASIVDTVPVRTYKTWYTVFGDLSNRACRPLVVVHGGPGISHGALASIADLSKSANIPVIFYDQIGCGNSTLLPHEGPEFWTIQFFLDELDNLLGHLGIEDDYDILGHSWGGMLAMELVVQRRSKGLKHMILADSLASMQSWIEGAKQLRSQLPQDIQDTMSKHEEARTTSSEEYEQAALVYYRRHLCRLDPFPGELVNSMLELKADATVYNSMAGPSEFHITGTLKDWTIVDRLKLVNVPTLVINGAYDQATDDVVRPLVDNTPGAKWVQFKHSSHMPHLEERDKYMDVVGKFLRDDLP